MALLVQSAVHPPQTNTELDRTMVLTRLRSVLGRREVYDRPNNDPTGPVTNEPFGGIEEKLCSEHSAQPAKDAFDLGLPPPAERHSAPPDLQRANTLPFLYRDTCMRLQLERLSQNRENERLADQLGNLTLELEIKDGQLEWAQRELDSRSEQIKRQEGILRAAWSRLEERDSDVLELRQEVAKLSVLVNKVRDSRFKSRRTIKWLAVDAEARAVAAETEVASLRKLLAESVEERRALESELWNFQAEDSIPADSAVDVDVDVTAIGIAVHQVFEVPGCPVSPL